MPFKSEKQRRYLWANEPEIARDWTDTYGSRIHKNEGGIMQGGVKNYLGKQKMVKAPLHWQSSPDHPKTELAYITQAEKDLLVKRDLHNSLNGGVNRGPAGIMSLNGWGSADDRQNVAGADISAGMDSDPGHKGWSTGVGANQTTQGQHGGWDTQAQHQVAQKQAIKDMGWRGNKPGPSIGNFGINFSGPGQNFMRNLNPLRWAGALIDNPFVSGAWNLLSSPFSGMSNLRQGMTQQEWEDARNERIRNKRIENILGRKAPITDMTLKNLERLGYTGEMPGVGSTQTSRAIAKDFEREGDDLYLQNPSKFYLASLGDKMGITGTQAYENFSPNVALSKLLANPDQLYEEFEANQVAQRDDLSQIKDHRADVSQADIDILTSMGGITHESDPADIRQRIQWQGNELNPTMTDQEIIDVLKKKITSPTGKFA